MLNDSKLISHGEGSCNRCLDWLDIYVTRWNRHKPIYELNNPNHLFCIPINFIFTLFLSGLVILLYGYYKNDVNFMVISLNITVLGLILTIFNMFSGCCMVCCKRVRIVKTSQIV